jgi:amidase
MSPEQITRTSGTDLAQAIRAGSVSSAAVVDAYLQRIDRLNPRINAVVRVAAARARQQADEADAALASGAETGLLHGVPFTVKDVIDTEGVVSAAGLEERSTFIPRHDAVVVARMRAAGAILLGKTNCPPGGGGGVTDNPVYGPTRNPHDLSRSPGGSSGGEAAAIAAGLSPLGLGSDSGGSLRVPAHFCGVATLKPTSGRVPNTGVLNHPGGFSDYRTQIGPIARSVRDLALVFDVIAGEDGVDAGVIPMPRGRADTVSLRGLRIATYADDGLHATTTATGEAVRAAADALARAGTLVQWTRPDISEARSITERYWRIDESSGADVLRLFEDWDRFRSRMLAFMANHDAIVCPVSADTAPPLGQGGVEIFDYTLPYSLTGWPCVVVPAATCPQRLPIGVQVVAKAWCEHTALAVAARIETALGTALGAPVPLHP